MERDYLEERTVEAQYRDEMSEMEEVKDTLTVIGKEWFDRANGNSYCAVRVFWNGDPVATAPFQYGYGEFYRQAAREALGEWMPPDTVVKYDNGEDLPLWQIARNGGFTLDAWIISNQTKRTVRDWGTAATRANKEWSDA